MGFVMVGREGGMKRQRDTRGEKGKEEERRGRRRWERLGNILTSQGRESEKCSGPALRTELPEKR